MPLRFRCSCRRAFLRHRWMKWIVAVLICPVPSAIGQTATCPVQPPGPATDADKAYSEGRYADAEHLYAREIAQQPQDIERSAALVRTLLKEGAIAEAASQVNGILPRNPDSAITLTAQAEVQLAQGQPWLVLRTLDAAAAADRCYARIHLIRSETLRIDSMYASERAEIQRAYDIDPADPDIQHAWKEIVSAAHDVESIDQSLATSHDSDPEARKAVDASRRELMLRLAENSQTCQIQPATASGSLQLLPATDDRAHHVYRYELAVQLPQSQAKLELDTSASGLYITRALAVRNGLQRGAGDPEGTVHLDSVRIGPFEFRDCTVGVSDTPFTGHVDGSIGTDLFASYLITVDYRSARLRLAPLLPRPGLLPGDRFVPAELRDFVPVYHRRQFLLLPVAFKNGSRQLFFLGTAMPYTAMSPEAVGSVSDIKQNVTDSERTASGRREQFYHSKFDFQLASLPLIQRRRILEFDFSDIDRQAGFQVAGVLGLDILHSMALHLDYRDGLAKFEVRDEDLAPQQTNGTEHTFRLADGHQ
jgi:tetratricopeptide (TPR) repeat protein